MKTSRLLTAFATAALLLGCAPGGQKAEGPYYIDIKDRAQLHEWFRYSPERPVVISGHRGGMVTGFPENCIESFEKTLTMMPSFFEIDPRMTKDSVIVLMHDATIDRTTTGTGKVSDYTYAELQQFFLKDRELIGRWVSGYLPRQRTLLNRVGSEMNRQIANYIRGKVIEIIICGGVTYIAFVALDLNYAALLALLFVLLGERTIRTRHRRGVALGHGDDPAMLRAMRVHANFAEYVPLALLLIYFVEASSQTPWLVHLLGASLLCGRLCHAFGMSRTPENFRYRVVGMGLTFSVILVSAAHILITALIS